MKLKKVETSSPEGTTSHRVLKKLGHLFGSMWLSVGRARLKGSRDKNVTVV